MQQEGVLSAESINKMIEQKQVILLSELDKTQIQPASLDLRLGAVAYQVPASFLPISCSVQERLQKIKHQKINLTQGAKLELGQVYIVQLSESLALPDTISASTNPKSSTGRIDVFTRVITDFGIEFDRIPAGYKGRLYLEICPRSFPIIIRQGSRLSQIRFRQGQVKYNDTELKTLHEQIGLVSEEKANINNGLGLSIDLQGDEEGLFGYRAKLNAGVIDVDRIAYLNWREYWTPLYTKEDKDFILEPDAFYILASREEVSIPATHAAEMVPFDPYVGEFRVHYAGFFDPGFGMNQAGGQGSRAVLEIRSREVPFILEHGQIIGRLIYEPLTTEPRKLYGNDLQSNYQGQTLRLSKHFK